jgi:hypothetical protein
MSAQAGKYWNARPAAVAMALPYPATFEVTSIRERLTIVRDTLVVLGMQVAFRAVMILRRLNY